MDDVLSHKRRGNTMWKGPVLCVEVDQRSGKLVVVGFRCLVFGGPAPAAGDLAGIVEPQCFGFPDTARIIESSLATV